MMDRRGWTLLALVALVLLGGCATSPAVRGGLVVTEGETGGGGGFPERTEDAFQLAQASCGLEEDVRHPAGAALYAEQARRLLNQLNRIHVTQRGFAPCRALAWLLGEVLAGAERVEYADLRWRARRFESLVSMRPDGYLVAALTGEPLQYLGPVRLDEEGWKVGRLFVGDFYFSSAGVLYPVNEALRRGDSFPWAERGLEQDWLNAALDGSQEAMVEMTVALGRSVLHPIRSVEDLAQLPQTVALLIASSPEYFARYGNMPREEQIREAARLATHAVMLLGGGSGAVGSVGRMGGLGAELPVLSLSAEGVLVLSQVARGGAVAATLGVEVGGFSILSMAGGGRKTGGVGQVSGVAPPPGPGKWIHKTPTTESEDALDYQEQVTGQPAWRVYMIGDMEFDGFDGWKLLEAKGLGYCSFFNPDGTPKYWYVNSGKFRQMVEQAQKQGEVAKNAGLHWSGTSQMPRLQGISKRYSRITSESSDCGSTTFRTWSEVSLWMRKDTMLAPIGAREKRRRMNAPDVRSTSSNC